MEDHHTEAMDRAQDRIDSIDSELVGAKGSTKRALKKQRRQQLDVYKDNKKDHDKHLKQDKKTEFKETKNTNKHQSLQAAYNNGIDPRANLVNAVGNVVESVGSASDKFLGGLSGFKATEKGSGSRASDMGQLMGVGIISIVLMLLMGGNARTR